MRSKVVAAALALAVSASVAAAAPAQRGVTSARPVVGLAADGDRAAFATAPTGSECGRVSIWNRRSRSPVLLGRTSTCPPGTSTGRGLEGPALAGTRALWVTYVGGNIREWSLWTATTSNRKPRRLAFVARDVDARGPFVLGEGDVSRFGDLLPYGVDNRLVVLGSNGKQRFTWRAPGRVLAVAAKDGEIAVATATPIESVTVSILDGSARVLNRESYQTIGLAGVAITGNSLVVQHDRGLERRGSGPPRVWRLRPGARFADASATLAVYVRGREIRVLRLDDSRDVVVRRATGTPHAQLESSGLFYAAGRRVSFVPMRELVRALR